MDSIQGAQQAIVANNGQRRDGVGGGLEYILYNIKGGLKDGINQNIQRQKIPLRHTAP